MPSLYGIWNPLGFVPAFVVPVFIDRSQSNKLLIQNISRNGMIAEFIAQHFVPVCELSVDKTAEQHAPALWAFAFTEDDIVVGTEAELRPLLLHALREGRFSSKPMLQIEVARFLNRPSFLRSTLATGFKFLETHSPVTATLWRDSDVLGPAIKESAAKWLRRAGFKDLLPGVDEIVTRSTSSELRVEVPDQLDVLVTDARFKKDNLGMLLELAGAVDIKTITLTRRADYVIHRNIPYGIIRGLNELSGTRTRTFESAVWPGVLPGHLPEGKVLHAPLFAFMAMGEGQPLARALDAVEDWKDWDVITCVIIVSNKRHVPRAQRLELATVLSRNFHYVFFVSTLPPLVEKRTLLKRSKPLKEGEIAQACAAAVLELTLSLKLGTSERVFSVFKNEGVGLFGEAPSSEGPAAALAASLLPHTSFTRASQAYLLSQNEAVGMSLPWAGPIANVANATKASGTKLIAFGIPLDSIGSASSFFYSCQAMLQSRGWKVTKPEPDRGRFVGVYRGISILFVTRVSEPESSGVIADAKSNFRTCLLVYVSRAEKKKLETYTDLDVVEYRNFSDYESALFAKEVGRLVL